MPEGQPQPRALEESAQTPRGSEQEAPLSEQMRGLIEFANLSPDELRLELRSMIERVKSLEEMSRTDELTGLLNRRGFYEKSHELESFFAREKKARKIEIPTALMVIDLDGFKQVNDSAGHAGGDECLKRIAEKVRATLRESDIFARVGGDEFNIFLADSTEEGAAMVAQKVRAIVEEVGNGLHEEFPSYTGALSASIGIITSEEDLPLEERIQKADYAAYVVKAAGKKGELTLNAARQVDAEGDFERDFLAGKALPR
jgi:diguanylate cyclase (GGDEF)-like protein